MPHSKILAIAAAGFALSCGAASAQAISTVDLNMRAGPGMNYGVVEVIPQGTPVEIRRCVANWCEVAFGGATGFASRNFLDMDTMTGQMGGPAPAGMFGQPGGTAPAGGTTGPGRAAPAGGTTGQRGGTAPAGGMPGPTGGAPAGPQY